MKALVMGKWRCAECGNELIPIRLGVLDHSEMKDVPCPWANKEFEQPWEELEEITPKSEHDDCLCHYAIKDWDGKTHDARCKYASAKRLG